MMNIEKIKEETKIYNEIYVKMNKKRAKIILNNKQYNLLTKIKSKIVGTLFKIKISKASLRLNSLII